MSEFKVSVALCTFNGVRFIEAQLKSILGQSQPADEMVVCDDGSTDGTVEIIQRLADRHPTRLRFIRNLSNLGINRNFAKAIGEATGDVIFLSDQDDFWFENKIAVMMAAFRGDPEVGLVYSDAELADETLRPIGQTFFGRRKNLQLDRERRARRLLQGIGFQGCMMAFRSILKDIVFPIPSSWGHDHWIASLAYATAKVRSISQPLLYYRRHGRNFGSDSDLKLFWLPSWLDRWGRIAENVSPAALPPGTELRWMDLLERLQEVKRRVPVATKFLLNDLVEECERHLAFGRSRNELRRGRRMARIAPILRAFRRGDYHRCAHGTRSLLKDLIL